MQAVKSLMLQVLTLTLGITLLATPVAFASAASGLSSGACSYLNTARNNTNTSSPANNSSSSISGCSSGEKLDSDNGGQEGLAHQIVDTILYVSGIISFVFILVGGFRYMTSTGDSGRIQSAKDTLLYAIIGLIVTFLALPISGFVIKTVSG
jgi:hypothetical protein